jgi:hypothetical protein
VAERRPGRFVGVAPSTTPVLDGVDRLATG